jgi:FixJ family two-component response regulator
MRILVVDDDESVRRSLAGHLEDLGHSVLHAKDGQSAVTAFATHGPDMVLMDLRMPVMGGLEAMQLILAKDAECPVIVISGAGQVAEAIEAIRAGAWDYLVKPIEDLSILSLAMDRALEKRSLRRQVKEYQAHLEHQVKERTADLETANEALLHKTIALKEVVNTVQAEKKEAIQTIATQIDQTVIPLLQRLQEASTPATKPIVDNVEESLRRIVKSEVEPLTQLAGSLTPMELRICRLIRREMTSKEIAQAEGISPETVETHRRNVRRKLKIANEQVNLTVYLQSLTELGS